MDKELDPHHEGLFGKNGSIPSGDRSRRENGSALKRKEKDDLHGGTETDRGIQTGPKELDPHHEGLFGKNGSILLGDRSCCENGSVLKRKEKDDLYGGTETDRGIQTGPKELDPHHLVALMSLTFANQQDGSRSLDPPSQQVKYGIIDDHNTSVRTFPVLDAIAGISVSEVGHQIVAVALQFNSRTQEIHLTVAASKADKKKLVSHITAVWEKLQALSNTYAERREKGSGLSGRRSPQMPGSVALPLRAEIFRDIYQFCLGKQVKRIKKWLKGLSSFMQQLVEHRGEAKLNDSELNLHYVVAGLVMVLESLIKLHDNPGSQFTDREWEMMLMQSMWATENATRVLGDGNRCEVLAQEITGHCSGGPFQLRRALEKLTFLARHVDSLISFAHSPRLRPALQYTVSVSTVPEQTRAVSLPTSQEQWQSILEAACTGRRYWQREKAEELLKNFQPDECVCPPHPECELIQYFEGKRDSPWDDIPPFTYIGVSRPSCSACRNWITAFNRLDGRQFHIGGTSGKWYWPWAMPMGPEPLGRIMAQKVSREYLLYQNLRSGLDETTTSSLVKARSSFKLSAARREQVLSMLAAREQKYGGTRLGFLKGFLSEHRDGGVLSKKQDREPHSD